MLGQCTIFCGSIGLNWLNMCPLTWMLHLPIPASGWLMEPQSVRWNRPSNRRMFDSYFLMMGVKNCWRAQNCWSQSRRFYFSAFCICGTCVWYFKVYVFPDPFYSHNLSCCRCSLEVWLQKVHLRIGFV
jgi:hypothetical protein